MIFNALADGQNDEKDLTDWRPIAFRFACKAPSIFRC